MMAKVRLRVWLIFGLAILIGVQIQPAPATVSADPVLVAAGDIACDPSSPYFGQDGGRNCEDDLTAGLIAAQNPTVVATLGDNQYNDGTLAQFQASYNQTWGRFKGKTRFAVGNHEYHSPHAQGYRDYTNNMGGGDLSYAYNLGTWRIYVLNSNCGQAEASCATKAAWIKRDIAANPHRCVMAYWHHPLRSDSAGSAGTNTVRPFWDALYAAKASVILSGHSHNYQNWVKTRPDGTVDPSRGIKQFVVGTGGKSLYGFATTDRRVQTQINDQFGILRLDLHATSYDYQFITASGVRDAGKRACRS